VICRLDLWRHHRTCGAISLDSWRHLTGPVAPSHWTRGATSLEKPPGRHLVGSGGPAETQQLTLHFLDLAEGGVAGSVRRPLLARQLGGVVEGATLRDRLQLVRVRHQPDWVLLVRRRRLLLSVAILLVDAAACAQLLVQVVLAEEGGVVGGVVATRRAGRALHGGLEVGQEGNERAEVVVAESNLALPSSRAEQGVRV